MITVDHCQARIAGEDGTRRHASATDILMNSGDCAARFTGSPVTSVVAFVMRCRRKCLIKRAEARVRSVIDSWAAGHESQRCRWEGSPSVAGLRQSTWHALRVSGLTPRAAWTGSPRGEARIGL